MMTLLIVIAAVALAILAAVVRLAVDVHAIRVDLLPDVEAALRRLAGSRGPIPVPMVPMTHHDHKFPGMKSGCFAVWEWRDGGWRLASDDLPEGVDPGPPPAYPGGFTGELVKTWIPGKPR